ncbi:MAG: MerR family transcriptional regulator [Candidatus Eisenbacteria bacterium]|uniref:MerR family transcriptional regulator n=1 Tax=Eiseniibacteriota bacterium TaxID=2212470 RepID=A0A538TUU3_UNCEI|nr:MAG: MerR family transcriptional regulator [Candidatus Eisenbacteria bacterium]
MIPNPSDADQKDRPLRVRKGMIRTQGAGGRNPVAKRVMEATNPKLLKVGDLARQTGKSVRALHLYEELGLLHPTARSHGGFRLYDATAITRIRWIELLQSSGFSLHQIQSLLHAWHGTKYGPDAMASIRDIFQKRLAEARQAIARYQALARELEGSLEYLTTCHQCRPPRTTQDDCPHCPVDHGMKEEPALVAGFHTGPPPLGSIPLLGESENG